jgi:hypothetical protein
VTTPWMVNRTMAREFHCPWSDRTVTLRFLTWDGEHPLGLIGCSVKDCDLKCLSEPDRIGAIFDPGQGAVGAPAVHQ